jgi:hypothetical protein
MNVVPELEAIKRQSHIVQQRLYKYASIENKVYVAQCFEKGHVKLDEQSKGDMYY